MQQIFIITAPIYLFIALGYVLVRRGLFGKPELRVLGRFVLQIGLPALLFKSLATRPIGEVLNAGYLGAMAAGSLVMFFVVFLSCRALRGKERTERVMLAVGTSFSNSAYIGYPIALHLLGPVAGIALALNLLVENLVMLPLMLALAESGAGQGRIRALKSAFAGLLRNPMVVAIVVGLGVSLLKLPLPAPLLRAVDIGSLAVAPVGLFVIGGSLVGLSTQGLRRDMAIVAAGKLIGHPLAVWGGVWLMAALALPLEPALRTAAVTMAAAPMLGIYPILAQKYGLEGPAAAAMLGTTMASFASITLLLALLAAGVVPWP